MIWLIIIAVIVVWIVIASRNANSPQRQLVALQEWLSGVPETHYKKVQDNLRKDIQTPYNKKEHWLYHSEKEYNERRNYDRLEYKENELWKRHLLTVMSSDKYTIDAKRNVCEAWYEYISPREQMIGAIEIGYLDNEGMDELRDRIVESRNSLIGVMEAFGFNLEKESKELEKEIAHKFPVGSNKVRKAVA